MAERVAVLLPVRNAEATLADALESLYTQTFTDFRIIAVDDASTDRTPEILRSSVAAAGAGAHLRRLTVVRLESSRGISAALSCAVAVSAGATFLARQDADDRSRPQRLEKQVAYLEAHPEIGVLATGVRTVRASGSGNADDSAASSGSTAGWRRYERWLESCVTPEQIALNLWIESPLPHPTVLMRRAAYDCVGGYQDVPWPEDYDLWLRMLRAGISMAKLPEVLYEWSDHPGRASRVQPAYSAESFLACRAHHLARFVAGREIIVWGAGRDGRRAARALLREGATIVSFLDIDRRKIGRTVYGKPVLAAEEWLEMARARGGRGAASSRPLVLAAVGTEGARELIRARLAAHRFSEGADFLCVA